MRGFEPPTPWSVAKCSIQLSYTHSLLIASTEYKAMYPLCQPVFRFSFFASAKHFHNAKILTLARELHHEFLHVALREITAHGEKKAHALPVLAVG